MTKKLLSLLTVVAALFVATSCDKNELSGNEMEGNSLVSFTLEQEGIATRSFSDGKTATTLTYAVYAAGDKKPLIVSKDEITFTNKTANVNIQLVNGKEYDILFWVDAPNAPYTFNENDQTITVNYTNVASNDESRDAFYAAKKAFSTNGPITETVKLYRPFAQLNIGSTDYAYASEKAGFTATKSSVKVKTYNTLNLYDGSVDGGAEVEFALANMPGADETFPQAGVKYMAMNYILVDSKELVEVAFTAATESNETVNRVYTNIPVQRNFRTNIYGNILTEATSWNLTIESEYSTPANDISIWDGVAATEFTAEQLAAPEIKINSAADLAGIINAVNINVDGDGRNKFANQTIVLTNDLDMNGFEIKPMGSFIDNFRFAGTFDGNGHTISNFKAINNDTRDNATAALFGALNENAVIKNLTVCGAEVYSTKYAGALCAYAGVTGNGTGGTSIVNCHVRNSKVTSTSNACGGIVGFLSVSGALVENCSVTDTEIVTTQRGGGLIGRVQSSPTVKDCAVKNITLTHYSGGELPDTKFIGNGTAQYAGTNTIYGFAEGVDYNLTNKVYGVSTAAGVEYVLNNAAEADIKIDLVEDIKGTVNINQKIGKSVLIDGKQHKYDGSIVIRNGADNSSEVGAVTLQNINFESDTFSGDFIYSNDKTNSVYNLSILKCTFKGSDDDVAFTSRQDRNVTIEDCIAEGLHSFVQSTSIKKLTIKNVTAKCTNGGVNLKTSASDAKLENCKFEIAKDYAYGVRADADNTSEHNTVQVIGCEFKASAPVLLRKATGKFDLTLSGTNTFNATNADGYQIVVTGGKDWDEENDLTSATGTITITGADDMKIYR